MKVVVQRVSQGRLEIRAEERAHIKQGFVILLGICEGDTERDALFLADKCAHLRVFEDSAGKMNLSLDDVHGSVLVVSQFTLYGDAQKGNRPSFVKAARPEIAEPLYQKFVRRMADVLGAERVRTGVFGEMMDVTIVNSGPVTIVIESPAVADVAERP
jgi:D-tyrosyl-tRNA(Tyr) deacylase